MFILGENTFENAVKEITFFNGISVKLKMKNVNYVCSLCTKSFMLDFFNHPRLKTTLNETIYVFCNNKYHV